MGFVSAILSAIGKLLVELFRTVVVRDKPDEVHVLGSERVKNDVDNAIIAELDDGDTTQSTNPAGEFRAITASDLESTNRTEDKSNE